MRNDGLRGSSQRGLTPPASEREAPGNVPDNTMTKVGATPKCNSASCRNITILPDPCTDRQDRINIPNLAFLNDFETVGHLDNGLSSRTMFRYIIVKEEEK
ncbi:hypothetical protein FPOAC2_04914 [Fusarium poae]